MESRKELADQCVALAKSGISDDEYALEVAKLRCAKRQNLMTGPKLVHKSDSEEVVSVCLEDIMSPVEVRLCGVLREKYGDALIVTARISGTGDVYGIAWVLHCDFMDKGARHFDRIERSGYDAYNDLEDLFAVKSLGGWYDLSQPLLSRGSPILDELVKSAIGPAIYKDGWKHVTVMNAIRGGEYDDCQTLGDAVHLGDPDLLKDGVVIDLLGKRVCVVVDIDKLMDEGRVSGEMLLSIRDAEGEPLTSQRERDEWNFSLQMMGVGRSQQTPAAAPFCGRLPRCLAVFEYGEDVTWTLMATVGDDDSIEVAWIECSST